MSIFLNIAEDKIIYRGNYFFLIYDAFPVSENHILIISNRTCLDYFELNPDEQKELPEMINKAKELIEENCKPDGYNIGMNCGEASGQTVMHFHCHVIPRFKNDVEDPRGGIRHCVMHKGYY